MIENKFSKQDAARLIVLARRAPLKDMAEAESAIALLDRFADCYKDKDPGSAE